MTRWCAVLSPSTARGSDEKQIRWLEAWARSRWLTERSQCASSTSPASMSVMSEYLKTTGNAAISRQNNETREQTDSWRVAGLFSYVSAEMWLNLMMKACLTQST